MAAGLQTAGRLAAVESAGLKVQVQRKAAAEEWEHSKFIAIEWHDKGAIIGTGGATAKGIKKQSGLRDLRVVCDNKGYHKVLLRGTADAITAAQAMVQSIVANARKARVSCRYASTAMGCKTGNQCPFRHVDAKKKNHATI